jgi:hypothetical protein
MSDNEDTKGLPMAVHNAILEAANIKIHILETLLRRQQIDPRTLLAGLAMCGYNMGHATSREKAGWAVEDADALMAELAKGDDHDE